MNQFYSAKPLINEKKNSNDFFKHNYVNTLTDKKNQKKSLNDIYFFIIVNSDSRR